MHATLDRAALLITRRQSHQHPERSELVEERRTRQIYHRWTPDDVERLRSLLDRNIPRSIIAARLKRTPLSIRGKLLALGYAKPKAPQWSHADNAYLVANLGLLSEAEIARHLGRTAGAVHLRWKRDLKLPAPSKRPDELTANQVAEGLGMDLHAVASWIDSGLLPGRRLPGRDVTRVVKRVTLLRWLVNPENWPHLKLDRVARGPSRRAGDIYDHDFWSHARRLLDLQRERWNDEWWTTNQVAAYHKVDNKDVLRHIALGRISAVRITNYSGRHPNPRWAHWYIRKSHATRPGLIFHRGKGSGHELHFSPEADAFLVLSRAIGLPIGYISALMRLPQKTLDHHLRSLHRRNLIQSIIRRHSLDVQYDRRTGRLFARWQDHRKRFPRLARLLRIFRDGHGPRTRAGVMTVLGVLRSWATWRARGQRQRAYAHNLFVVGRRTAPHLHAIHQTLKGWGADPLKLRP
jgi:hypothetical protein